MRHCNRDRDRDRERERERPRQRQRQRQSTADEERKSKTLDRFDIEGNDFHSSFTFPIIHLPFFCTYSLSLRLIPSFVHFSRYKKNFALIFFAVRFDRILILLPPCLRLFFSFFFMSIQVYTSGLLDSHHQTTHSS